MLRFEDYIEPKIKKALDVDKKQGRRRDITLLIDVLTTLFWRRAFPNRTIYDILPAIHIRHANLSKDTLEDNLEFLSKIPKTEPFLKISRESQEINVYNSLNTYINQTRIKLPRRKGKPKNVYTLNDYYIVDFYRGTNAQLVEASIVLEPVISPTE